MEAKELRQRILDIIGDVMLFSINENDNIILDCYDQGELCFAFESEFEIDIWSLDWSKIETAGDLVNVVVERIENLK